MPYKDPEKRKQKAREYQQKFVATHPGYYKKWHKDHPGKKRDYDRKYYYGMPCGAYEELWAAQEGRCAISVCRKPLPKNAPVDHDHHTNKVRGILCISCNTRIGGLDDPEYRTAALDYITQHQTIERKDLETQDHQVIPFPTKPRGAKAPARRQRSDSVECSR